MSKLKLILALSGALLLAGIAPGTADDASFAGSASATIQATAHVAPSIGLARAELIGSTSIDELQRFESKSHLYWLYYPRVDGIQIRVQGAGQSLIEGRLKDTDPAELGFRVLTEHGYASLVDLTGLEQVAGETAAPMTITLVYTDN